MTNSSGMGLMLATPILPCMCISQSEVQISKPSHRHSVYHLCYPVPSSIMLGILTCTCIWQERVVKPLSSGQPQMLEHWLYRAVRAYTYGFLPSFRQRAIQQSINQNPPETPHRRNITQHSTVRSRENGGKRWGGRSHSPNVKNFSSLLAKVSHH